MVNKQSKNFKKKGKLVDPKVLYDPEVAFKLVQATSGSKYDGSVEIAIVLGVDTTKSDQQVRGSLVLPAGLGKTKSILALTNSKQQAAKAAGADFVGGQDLIDKIKSENWFKFDAVVATPDIMPQLAKISRYLGPKKLMPSVKNKTITDDLPQAIQELNKGKVFYRADRKSNINLAIGKVSFTLSQLMTNYHALIEAIKSKRPATSKGRYIKQITVSASIGPGIKVVLP